MKKTIFNIIFIAASLLIASCIEKEPQNEEKDKYSIVLAAPEYAELYFDESASVQNISFSSSADWSVEFVNDRAEGWCSVSTEEGKGGKNTLEIKVEASNSSLERNASFNIISGTERQTVTVTQKPAGSILLSASKIEVDGEGGERNLILRSGSTGTASIPEEYSSWLSITGSEKNTVTCKIGQYKGIAVREGKIEIRTDTASETVTIYQTGTKSLPVLSKTSYWIKNDATEIKLDITNGINATLTAPSVDWISENQEKSSGTNTYYFTVTENQTTETRTANIIFTNEENGIKQTIKVSQSGKKGPGAIRILAIGNSFSDDSMWYLYDLLKEAGYESVKLGNLYIGGCTLQTHANNITTGSKSYTYRINDNGKWVDNNSHNAIDALNSDNWDFISLQQASGSSGKADTYEPYITTIISNVKELCPEAKIMWNMTWAYQGNSDHSEFSKYDKDQMTMYNAIVSAVHDKVLTNKDFDIVIPAGTAIQNLRTSLYGDTVTRDGYHLSFDSGRLTAAMMWLKSLTGCNLEDITWTPSGYMFTSARKNAIKEAVENAYKNPYQVTESTFTEDYEDPTESLSSLLKSQGYDPDLYTELDLEITKFAYYNSSNGNATLGTDLKNFAATKIFEKSQIPEGSLIAVMEGYQYRPEGWSALDVKTTPRPDIVNNPIVVVDEAWWREFNFRGFNLSKTGNPELNETEQEELKSKFGIFVPKEGTDNIFTAAGYKLEDYNKLKLDITPNAHYNSGGNSNFSSMIFSMTNFAATRIFTKEDIPVGSVIVQKDGYQYRPEGWTDLDQKTTNRPGNVTDQIVVVDETWWKEFNFRAFNLARKGAPTLTYDEHIELKNAYSIYVPKK